MSGILNAVVVYSSRYGNTERIARSFEKGLRDAGLQTTCLDTQKVDSQTLSRYDLLCVAGPTEWTSASKQMKEFLRSLKGTSLSGKFGFAFDTKLGSPLSGSAAKYIERTLSDLGVKMVAPRESAIVSNRRGGSGTPGAVLKEGEEARFEGIGLRVGTLATRAAQKNLPSA